MNVIICFPSGILRRLSSRTGLLSCVLAVFALSTLEAQTGNLVENSPFLPEGFVPPGQREPEPEPEEPEPEPMEDPVLDNLMLRGITVVGGESYFSLYNSESSNSFWLRVDDMEEGITLVEFDEWNDTVVVRRNGVERSLALQEASIAPPPSQGQGGGGGGGGRSRADESAEEREQRLHEAAEELRRRRAIRTRGGGVF